MRRYLLVLFIFVLFLSTAVDAQQVTHMGLVKASCKSLEAIKDIAEADKVSEKKATAIFYSYAQEEICGSYAQPRMAPLERKEGSYIDSNNHRTEIWKIYGVDFWALIKSKFVKKVPFQDQNNHKQISI
jgi:hypothetical protein